MEINARISVSKEQLEEFCKRHHIRKLSFFGSVLRTGFGPTSDIDVLVELDPEQKVGLLRMAHIENDLSALLRRKVDLRTREDLSRYFRQEVVDSAETYYAEA